jgi:hypothetical protein
MRREGACEVGGERDATWEASRQPSVFMLTRRVAVFAAMRPTLLFNRVFRFFIIPTPDEAGSCRWFIFNL